MIVWNPNDFPKVGLCPKLDVHGLTSCYPAPTGPVAVPMDQGSGATEMGTLCYNSMNNPITNPTSSPMTNSLSTCSGSGGYTPGVNDLQQVSLLDCPAIEQLG